MQFSQKIITNLWFNDNAEEAVKFYTSVFKNSATGAVIRYSKEGSEIHGHQEGEILTIEFELNGKPFLALNGGPNFKFNESISLIINCGSQEEIDYYWERLSEGGDERSQQCGWLKDKYGLSWQVVWSGLSEKLKDYTSEEAQTAMKKLLKMTKIIIADFETVNKPEMV
jgi:predicted 3-demethylubiquinone-9 3-methyltransferase (glyoxalase superfamily)